MSRRLEVAGVGVVVPAGKLNAKSLMQAVERAIEMRGAAQEIARTMRKAGGPEKVVEEIEIRLHSRGMSPGA